AERRAAVRRIVLYSLSVRATRRALEPLLGPGIMSRESWHRIRSIYAELIRDAADAGFYKTFFSSLTRRIFNTVGVDPHVEFLALDVEPDLASAPPLKTREYVNRGSLALLFEELLGDLPFSRLGRATAGPTGFMAAEIEAFRRERRLPDAPRSVEVIPSLFYRGRRAYLVGRLLGGAWQVPLVLPFAHTDDGIISDVVILSENDVSMLFGFTRSYFHVDLDIVGSAVRFLHELMPQKPVEELYTVLGRAKQGKTEHRVQLLDGFLRHELVQEKP